MKKLHAIPLAVVIYVITLGILGFLWFGAAMQCGDYVPTDGTPANPPALCKVVDPKTPLSNGLLFVALLTLPGVVPAGALYWLSHK